MIGRIQDIRFYDFEFNLLHVENHFVSSNWKICYNDIGSFEAHFDLQSDTLPIIMENDYIVAVQGKQTAIIVGKNLGDDLTIFGRTCNWLLTKRVTGKFDAEEKTVYDWVTSKVSSAFSDSPVVIGTALAGTPKITAERSDKCETFKVVQQLLQQEHLGHEMTFDLASSKFVFNVLNGNENNQLVISTANRNAYDVTMYGDSLKFSNEGWYKVKMDYIGDYDPLSDTCIKDGEYAPKPSMVSSTKAANFGKYWKVTADSTQIRFELSDLKKGDFIVCHNTNGTLEKSDDPFWTKFPKTSPKTGIYRWESLLSGENESEASAALATTGRTNTIQGKTAKVYFGKEYKLGDVVTVQFQAEQYKFSARKRIVGVNLWYESGNVGEEPVFEDVEK